MEPLTPLRRRERTRQHLLAAAAEVFARRGYHDATLDEVAATAGFTKGAVYSNFSGKEDLFLALAEEHMAETLSRVRATLGSSAVPAGDRLEDFGRLAFENFEQEQESTALYLEFALYALRHPDVRQRLAAIDRAQAAAIQTIVAEEHGQGIPMGGEEAATFAGLVVALFRGISIVGLIDPDAVDATLLDAAVRLVDRGLSGDPS